MSPKWVRPIAHTTGLAQAEAARAEAEAVVARRLEVDVEQMARELALALDGGWVKRREQPSGMEGTGGVLATGRVATGKPCRTLLDRRVVATVAGVEEIGALAYREAAWLAVKRAEAGQVEEALAVVETERGGQRGSVGTLSGQPAGVDRQCRGPQGPGGGDGAWAGREGSGFGGDAALHGARDEVDAARGGGHRGHTDELHQCGLSGASAKSTQPLPEGLCPVADGADAGGADPR